MSATRYCVYRDSVYGRNGFGPVNQCPKHLDADEEHYVKAVRHEALLLALKNEADSLRNEILSVECDHETAMAEIRAELEAAKAAHADTHLVLKDVRNDLDEEFQNTTRLEKEAEAAKAEIARLHDKRYAGVKLAQLAPHQQRVISEQEQLAERLKKLEAFLLTAMFAELVEDEQLLLKIQASAMAVYLRILKKRSAKFTSPNDQ